LAGATQQLSPSHLSLGDFRKYHPRAKEYMEALEEHLEIIRKEVDRASVITYIESWPRRNAKKKEVKFAVGDYMSCYTNPCTYQERLPSPRRAGMDLGRR
jgi:hypothetical protein